MKYSPSHVHPSLIEAMKLDAKAWREGEGDIVARTKGGKQYRVSNAGFVQQDPATRGHPTGRLGGAVYRMHGPIRVGQVVVGLKIEYYPEDEKVTCQTSSVIGIER